MTFRPNLKEIENSYADVLHNWPRIDDQLEKLKIGRKDTPFNQELIDNMLLAWEFVDYYIHKKKGDLLSREGGPDMLEINHLVHYGLNKELRQEYRKAMAATTEKFSEQVKPIRHYYKKKTKDKQSINKIASNVYVAVLGQPQLFIEGNHRSGSIIASWINLVHKKPPFVLTVENAVAFFRPAQEIKKFNKKAMWRSMTQLPKHKKAFEKFWVNHCDKRFCL